MAARKRKPKHDLSSQDDARAPLDPTAFLAAAKPVLVTLTKDLLERADASPNVTATLKQRHAHDFEHQRTADKYPEWRRAFVDQVAAAWLLSCVFARTLEDRGLVSRARIAGRGALDSERMFRQLAPSLSERDYLLAVFRELTRLPAARDLFDARHNPVWLLGPSAEAARALLALFRAPQPEAPAFRFGSPDTRFLGDLYQDLNEDVKKRYALLQTPRFVEEFILDRTLDRAIERFGLADTTLIDPTCGSGHFLLGAFERLFRRRLEAEPCLGEREAARLALDAVSGADINPYAVAVARFRLTLAFLEKAGFDRLDQAPALPLHVAIADSLLHNPQLAQAEFKNLEGQRADAWSGQEFALEDEAAARDVLHRQYAAVVGNPPYITVKDAVLRDRYREYYKSAFRSYSLGVPFTERFFQLGKKGGAVGMITANSFMKREFGKKLIEEYLPTVNLDLIINTSGAYIPGHGTPTVLLFGTNEPAVGTQVHALLASRGEPSTPDDPEQGLVWRSIADHWNDLGFENDYITVAEVERSALAKHPWSLGGGGATELKELLEERAVGRLVDVVDAIGRTTHTGEDSFFFMPLDAATRLGVERSGLVPLVKGEQVRDWVIVEDEVSLFPYDLATAEAREPRGRAGALYWMYRTILRNRQDYGEKIESRGLRWFEHSMFFPERYLRPLGIAFAFVATHNHFVLDRGGKGFKQSAPIIKLPETATEDDHLALLAYLNSSTGCFWMKQVFQAKSSQRDVGEGKDKPERTHYEFTGTGLLELPVPPLEPASRDKLVVLSRRASSLATHAVALGGSRVISAVAQGPAPPEEIIEQVRLERHAGRAELVGIQEEIDWLIYSAFGIAHYDESEVSAPPERRPFCAGSTEDVPIQWRERRAQQNSTAELRLLEDPVFKRPWLGRQGVFGHGTQTFDQEIAAAAGEWVRDRAEERLRSSDSPVSLRQLVADLLLRGDLRRVCALLGEVLETATRDVLVWRDAVPFLASYRFTGSGMEKYARWRAVWALQRQEDLGETTGPIAVPPKYAQGDFRNAEYWRLRGKLDVPKERFISYPGCESDEDGEPVYGWAGWDHAQRAAALGALYMKRKGEGWDKVRLMPMLAGLLELLPWLHQWHAEPDPEYGRSAAEEFQDFLDGECREHGFTHADLRAWRPAEKRGRTKKRSAKASEAET